jgi:hypothetical protein
VFVLSTVDGFGDAKKGSMIPDVEKFKTALLFGTG